MTENEATKVLYTMRLAAGLDDFEKPGGVPVLLTKEELADACMLAIKALGEVQQYRKHGLTVENALDNMCDLAAAENLIEEYREIGTPEECRKSVDICKAMAERRISLKNMENYMKFEDECISKGFTFNSLLEAREKQMTKKPIRLDKCTCPSCSTYNETWKKRRNTIPSDIVYCWHCGQAVKIKRSDEE